MQCEISSREQPNHVLYIKYPRINVYVTTKRPERWRNLLLDVAA